ncbi:MAG TPA: tRNA-dihydrouridine synthase [Candidatus Saccharimonadales bacterium]|nr:tRNA-dihydrouridine synthase [Candidatus Saccharimonadales bacterium]
MNNFWQDLPRPFFALAPMDGVTDVTFRHVVARAVRPDVFFSEFTSTATFFSERGRSSTDGRLAFMPEEQPMVAQIWGTDPEKFAFMARELAARGFAGIDINMGCPIKNVVKIGACSALINTPSLAAEIITATKEGGIPVSVKTRIGFKTIQTEEWLGFLLNQDIAALTVHGRTQREQSRVPAHWDEIAKVVALRDQLAPRTIVMGNGDVANRTEGLQRIKETGVDGIMIGRGVFHDVFCFEPEPRQHTHKELMDLLAYHLDLWEASPHALPFSPLKRFFKIYVRDQHDATTLRAQLMQTESIAEVRQLLHL